MSVLLNLLSYLHVNLPISRLTIGLSISRAQVDFYLNFSENHLKHSYMILLSILELVNSTEPFVRFKHWCAVRVLEKEKKRTTPVGTSFC